MRRHGDQDKANALLDESLAVSSELGLRPLMERVLSRREISEILPTLISAEAEEWRIAVAEAEAEGTYFIAEPYHCAVGTKP